MNVTNVSSNLLQSSSGYASYPEAGGSRFLRNAGDVLLDYTPPQNRRQYMSDLTYPALPAVQHEISPPNGHLPPLALGIRSSSFFVYSR
jgi:hypothetical protein